MTNLQDLIRLAQSVGGGGAPPVTPSGGNPLQALQALVGSSGGMPQGGGSSSMLDAMARAQASSPRAMAIPSGGTAENMGAIGTGPGPITDGGLTDMLNASDAIRKDLPPSKRDAYTGSDEDEPMSETRQTPMPSPQFGKGIPVDIGSPDAPGQAIMGAYLNRNKGQPSTEQELADVQKRMGGSGNPVEDGNFPSQKEIDDLNAGKIDPKDFDEKWGKGAAKEMMDNVDDEPDEKDDGDHEYR